MPVPPRHLVAALALLFAAGCAHRGAAGGAGVGAAIAAAPAGHFRFVDVAGAAGLTRTYLAGRPGKDHLLDSAGAGVAFLDYDRDGRLDIYLPNGWRLDGARVVERGVNALYRGLPDGTFRDVTAEAGVGGEGEWGAGVVAADYDGDGDLDLYIAAYIKCTLEDVLRARPTLDWKGLEKVAFGPFGLEGAPDHFFRQEPGGRFVDATAEAGMTDRGLGFGFAVRAGDYDGDGDLDLYVANDSDPNYLYRNEGNGVFREIGVWSGCALDAGGAAQASMGIAAGDTTGSGRTDLVVTNFSQDFSTIYRNLGDGFFEDVSEETGVGPATWRSLSWGVALADFDADGDLDLVIANGHIYPQIDRHPEVLGTYAQQNLLLENRGGRFVDVTDAAGPGFAVVESSRGLAVGDYDNDGDLDILILNLDAPPTLLRNDTPQGAWIVVVPEGPRGGPPPPGTRVTVRTGGRMFFREVAAGDSYAGCHDPRLHFGLGSADRADSIEVRWPDGATATIRDQPVRQFVRVPRPKDSLRPVQEAAPR